MGLVCEEMTGCLTWISNVFELDRQFPRKRFFFMTDGNINQRLQNLWGFGDLRVEIFTLCLVVATPLVSPPVHKGMGYDRTVIG